MACFWTPCRDTDFSWISRQEKLPRSWQKIQEIQDLGKKRKIQHLGKNFKNIQDYQRSWAKNLDAKHRVCIILQDRAKNFQGSSKFFSDRITRENSRNSLPLLLGYKLFRVKMFRCANICKQNIGASLKSLYIVHPSSRITPTVRIEV